MSAGEKVATLDVAEAIRRVVYLPMTQIIDRNDHAPMIASSYATPQYLVQNLIRAAEHLLTQRDALEAEVKRLDPDPVVCGCREAMCPHTPIAQLPRQMLVDHFRERIKTEKTERDALEAREKVLVALLKECADRFEFCCKSSGNDAFYAAKAVEKYRAALATGAPKP